MKIPALQLGSAALYGAAGFCVFLIVLNRVLILMPDSKVKRPLILGTFALVTGGGAMFGFFFACWPWIAVPLAVFSLVLVGEGRRAAIRRSCAGSGPVDTIPHKVNIASPITTTDLVPHRYEVPHPAWRGPPLRIAHLTDLHVHPNLPLDFYQEVVSAAEQTAPDIALFTGDFITSLNSLPMLQQVLRPIAKLATYAVLGNHDYWLDADAIGKSVRNSGLRLLSNESVALPVGEAGIAVTGYDYPWGTREESIQFQQDAALHIVLSHTPDNIYRIAKSSADLVFSGHYHAGQIRIPVLGSVVIPSAYGRRFDHGHFIVNGTHLFVAGGIGAASPPVRIYCQPDIFIVDVVPQKSG